MENVMSALRHKLEQWKQSQAVPNACPKCRAGIPSEDVNIKDGVALCRACSSICRLTEIVESAELPDIAKEATPAGCYVSENGADTVIGASARSVGGFIGTLFICLFWNGIVSVFVSLAFASTLGHLGVTMPGWMPPVKMNGGAMSIGMTLFLWVFLTPFMLVGLAIVLGMFMALAGRVEVTIRGDEGSIFAGVGSIGRTRRFKLADVKRVDLRISRDSEGSKSTKIVIEAERELKLGDGLPEERKRWLAAALRAALAP